MTPEEDCELCNEEYERLVTDLRGAVKHLRRQLDKEVDRRDYWRDKYLRLNAQADDSPRDVDTNGWCFLREDMQFFERRQP